MRLPISPNVRAAIARIDAADEARLHTSAMPDTDSDPMPEPEFRLRQWLRMIADSTTDSRIESFAHAALRDEPFPVKRIANEA